MVQRLDSRRYMAMSYERCLRIPAVSPYTYLQSNSCVASNFGAELKSGLESFKRASDYIDGQGVYAGSRDHTSALAACMPGILTLERLRDWVEIGELPILLEREGEPCVVPLKVRFLHVILKLPPLIPLRCSGLHVSEMTSMIPPLPKE